MPYKLVYVEWVDSTGKSGWLDVNKIGKPCLGCVSTGYLVDEDKDMLAIAPHIAEMEGGKWNVDGVFWIPKCAVKKKRVIKL